MAKKRATRRPEKHRFFISASRWVMELVPTMASGRGLSFQIEFQGLRGVVDLIPGARHQGEVSIPALFPEQPDFLALVSQFGPITLAKFLPFPGIVAEPFAQLRAGRHLLEPEVQRHLLFAKTPGPETLHQNPEAVIRGGGQIGPFRPDHDSPCWLFCGGCAPTEIAARGRGTAAGGAGPAFALRAVSRRLMAS